MRRRRRPNWPLRWLAAGMAAAALTYIVIVPWLDLQQPHNLRRQAGDELRVRCERRALEFFGVAWFFFVGASVGSFLNVVIYRAPRGLRASGRSYCPYCATQILGRDNLPLVGWVALRGRCRACRLPISPRYPIVESMGGAVFVALFAAELLSGGANLPGPRPVSRGFDNILYEPQWPLIGQYAYHVVALCGLLAWSWMKHDSRQRAGLPARSVAVAFAAAVAPPWIWPQLHPVAWDLPAAPGAAPWLTGPVGLAAGWLLGNELDRSTRLRTDAALFLALSGAVLGWQAALGIGVLSAVAIVVARTWQWPLPAGAAIGLATLIQLLFWSSLVAWRGWPGGGAGLASHAAWALAVSAVAWALRWQEAASGK